MSPQNQGNSPKQPKKLKSLSSKPLTGSLPPRVPEQIPLWLHDLLSKHGEAPGLLVGLEETFGSPFPVAEEEEVVSLLEQMGEEGIDEFAAGPIATSVEWRQLRSPMAGDKANIEDLLSSISPGKEAEATSAVWRADLSHGPQAEIETPDWLNEIVPAQDSSSGALQGRSEAFDETPDWLTEALNEPVTFDETRPAVLDFSSGLTDQPSTGGVEVPDWLASALDEPVTPETDVAQTSPLDRVEVEVPDWITESITSAINETPAVEANVPDWLSESAALADSPGLNTGQVEDAPDWLHPPVAAESTGGPETEDDLGVPDWLSDSSPLEIPAPSATSEEVVDLSHIPDWLSVGREPSPASTTPDTDELDLSDIPDWLSEAPVTPPSPTSETAQTDIPDWLAGPAVEEESDLKPDDWLNDLRFDTAENESTEDSDDELAAPGVSPTGLDLLSGFGRPPASETLAHPGDTGWLRDLEPPPGTTETSATTATSPTPETDPMHTGWLRDLDLPSGADTQTAEVAAIPSSEPDDIEWLSSLETIDSAEAKARVEASTPETDPMHTGWLRDLDLPPGADSGTTAEAEAQVAKSDWLNDLRQYADTGDAPSHEASDLPGWLVEPDEAEASTMPAATADAGNWLSTFRRETEGSVEVVEDELPDWLSEDSEVGEAATEATASAETSQTFELPAWLSEEVEADTGRADKPAANLPDWMAADPDLPDWLNDSSADDSMAKPAGPRADADFAQLAAAGAGLTGAIIEEAELPDWLREGERDSNAASPAPEPVEPVDRAELELAEALADVPSDHAFEPELLSFETGPNEAEGGLPSWLQDLPSIEKTEGVGPSLSADLELDLSAADENEIVIPDWLGESSATPYEPEQGRLEPASPETKDDEPASIQAAPLAVDEADEIPAWLSDLQPTPQEIEETGDVSVDQVLDTGKDFELPDWLAGLSNTAQEGATLAENQDISEFLAEVESPHGSSDDEAKMGDWLSNLRVEADQASTETGHEPATPPAADSDDDLQLPAWFSSVPGPATPAGAEPVAASSEAGVEAIEFPDWLSDLPAAAEEETPVEMPAEVEAPNWLAELQAISSETVGDEAEVSPPTTADVEAAANEMPDWFTAPPVDDAAPSAETDDLAIPDWLKASPAAAPPGPAAVQFDSEAGAEALVGPVALSGLLSRAVSDFDQEPAREPAEPLDDQAEVAEQEFGDFGDVRDLDLPNWLSDSDELVQEQEETGARAVESDLQPLQSEVPGVGFAAPQTSEPPGDNWIAGLRNVTTETPERDVDALSEESDSELEWGSAVAGAAVSGVAVGAVDLAGRLFGPQASAEDDSVPMDAKALEVGLAESSEFDSAATEIGQFELETPEIAAEVSAPEEIPAWLADMPDVDEIAGLDSPDDDTPDEEFSFEVDELDVPDWLADLPQIGKVADEADANIQAVSAEASAPSTTDSDQLSLPDWLSDLPEIESREAPKAETEDVIAGTDRATSGVAGFGAEEPSMPDWFSEPAADSGPTLTADSLIGEEPAWMVGLREATQGRLDPERFQESSVVEPTEAAAEDSAADIPAPSWLMETQKVEDEDIPTPDWLVEEISEDKTAFAPAGGDDSEVLLWPDRRQDEAEDLSSQASFEIDLESLEAEAPLPDWLQDLDLAAADETAAAEPAKGERLAETNDIPAWLRETGESTESYQMMMSELAAEGYALEAGLDSEASPEPGLPDWLTDSQMESLEMPDWLVDSGEGESEKPVAPLLAARLPGKADPLARLEEPRPEEPTEMPSRDVESVLAGLFSDTPSSELAFESPTAFTEPVAEPVQPEASVHESGGVERMSSWLQDLEVNERVEAKADSQVAESTGVLGGLGRLLPAERVSTPTTVPDKDWETAARQFQEVVSQPRQPATLPETPARKENFFVRLIRALFQMLFIGVVALPLLPPLQKTVNGQSLPWTEPAGAFGGVLENQRREMLSEQLGLIDVQPLDAVALVSFDYSPASQGEMQPLAEAILGRLKGQGMRLLAVSLDPEGPAMAQQTIEAVLAERGQEDRYGLDMVNLGYLPGQVTAVRGLAAGQSFASLTDFNSGRTLAELERGDWQSIDNISHVDLVITLADNPTTARWWVEQLELAPPPASGEKRPLLAATSATADPFLRPYRQSGQLEGLISGINGAAAIEALRNDFGPARQMLDSQSLAHLIIIVVIALGTMVGFVPSVLPPDENIEPEAPIEGEEKPASFESLRSRLNTEAGEAAKRN